MSDASLVDLLPTCLPPGSKPVSPRAAVDHLYSLRVDRIGRWAGRAPAHALFAGPLAVSRRRSARSVLESLRRHLEALVAETARTRLFVHAGVVGWRGRAVLIPGRSGSGKTTLVAALVRAGATYYSDEYAVLDEHGRVHPFPRPLCLRRGGRAWTGGVTAAAFEGRAGNRPLPVGLVAVTVYRPRARWRPRELSPGEALLALLDNTIQARHPDVTLPVLRRAVRAARAIRSARGEADDAVAALLA